MIEGYTNRMAKPEQNRNEPKLAGGRYVREKDGTLYKINEATGERELLHSPVVGDQVPADPETPDTHEE